MSITAARKQELIKEYGESCPQLLIVGGRGWKANDVFYQLENEASFPGYVFELGKLNNETLSELMYNATGALMPSFVEGFSLPFVEARIRNIPTIASDIPVHRELSKEHDKLLSPYDKSAWKKAIMATVKSHTGNVSQRLRTSDDGKFTWTDHFLKIEPFVFKSAIH